MKLYPLKFKPEMKHRVWGGRALEQFGFVMPEGSIGEAWVLSEHPNGTTPVANGPLAGLTLTEARHKVGEAWFGAGRFPLLVKLLDCREDLSVQVHPGDDYGGLPAGEQGKTEMWYVLDAKPGAQIIFGLKENVTREALKQAIAEDRIMETMNVIEVKAGDAFFIPAGTVHALGRGVLVAEIQQNSDTTYRLYDYKRSGLDGNLRELHIEDSLNVIAYQNEGATYQSTSPSPRQWLELARSPYFIVEKGTVNARDSWELSMPKPSYVIHLIGEGAGTLTWEHGECPVTAGEALLLPAHLGAYTFTAAKNMTLLRCYLP